MQSLTEDVSRQMEREKILQQRYGELQEQIKEIQESLNSQQLHGASQDENKDYQVVSDNIYESNEFSEANRINNVENSDTL